MNNSAQTTSGGYHGARGTEAPCRDTVRRALLVPYALGRCTEAEALALEGHLLTCEACFQDLEVLDRAGVLLREHVGAPRGREPA